MSLRAPQTIIPRLPGSYVGGRWQDGPDGDPTAILASVQPASSGDYDQMQAEQPGRRIERMVRLYTDVRLNVAGENSTNGDSLEWLGERYLLVAVSPWQSGIIPHYRYLAAMTKLP
ncbi:MAG: hypothetical protein WBA82_08005 [Castellaniella sp.]|uniref:hypothetical protein n=1 Tax=Castellaniella sp. TaxID=1955812 RepID=UPI003C73A7E2